MIRITYKLCVVFSIVSPSLAESNARKYSLEQESLNLYGQDFQTVLKRFRRTPDYLKILQDKMAEIKMSSKDVGLQVFHYTYGKMEDRVMKILHLSKPKAQRGGANKGEMESPYYPTLNYRRRYAQLNTPEDAMEDASETKIQNLDNYKAFSSELSVGERNQMKNLGFELAGSIIHTMIDHLDVQKPYKQTAAPEQAGAKTTSVHPEKHEITSDTTKSSETQTEVEVTFMVTSPSTYELEGVPKLTPANPVKATALRAGMDEYSPPIENFTHTIFIY